MSLFRVGKPTHDLRVLLVENSTVMFLPILSLPYLMMRNHWSCIVVGRWSSVCSESFKCHQYTLLSCCGPIACSHVIAVISSYEPLLLFALSSSWKALFLCS